MKTLQRLLAIVGLCLLMLLPMSNLGNAQRSGDQRFINVEETIGKTQEEVEKKIGAPHDTGTCVMSTSIGGRVVTFKGQEWDYEERAADGTVSLIICFIKGYSVSEQRVMSQMEENGREEVFVRAVFDHRVLRKVIDGKPERENWIDPDGPSV